jgi:hypothetical protein
MRRTPAHSSATFSRDALSKLYVEKVQAYFIEMLRKTDSLSKSLTQASTNRASEVCKVGYWNNFRYSYVRFKTTFHTIFMWDTETHLASIREAPCSNTDETSCPYLSLLEVFRNAFRKHRHGILKLLSARVLEADVSEEWGNGSWRQPTPQVHKIGKAAIRLQHSLSQSSHIIAEPPFISTHSFTFRYYKISTSETAS